MADDRDEIKQNQPLDEEIEEEWGRDTSEVDNDEARVNGY